MEKLITHNINALRFLMNEDLYVVEDLVQTEKQEELPQDPIIREELPPTGAVISEDKSTVTNFSYLGENNRYFLVLVDDKTHKELNTPHREMLLKIMAAKKLELRDLAILNLAQYPGTNFEQLKDFFSCNRIILFGMNPGDIGLPAMGANQPVKHQSVKVLATFGLGEMSINTDKKREFWNVMKDF